MASAATPPKSHIRTPVQIYDRTIAPGHPVFVIAEAGSNHNGDLALALELIDAAAEAQADVDRVVETVTRAARAAL